MRRGQVIAAFVGMGMALGSGGCMFGRFFTRNLEASTRPMMRVPNKVTAPVRADARLSVLWVGHATVLLQLEDKLILTDPVFTDTVGQVSRRLVEPGLEVENLPAVDAVLISHMHFDHMSLGSIEMIEDKVRWLGLPRGGLVYLTDFGFPAQEVRWWETVEIGEGLRVTGVPVAHNGWRYGLDRQWMMHSFTGWVIEYRGMTVYYGGDTAYAREVFRQTARRFENIDLALLPVGPIHPRDFMRSLHLDPGQALEAYRDLGARWMIPIHFETFVNSTDAPYEPRQVLLEQMAQRGMTHREVQVMHIGEQRVLIRRQDERAADL